MGNNMEKKGASITGGEIAAATGGSVFRGNAAKCCRGVSTDSRQFQEENLFVALRGPHFDGHDFLANVLEHSAGGLLIEEKSVKKLPHETGDIPIILVEDTLQALGDLAHDWRMRFNATITTITGSTGKTTTKEMLASILAGKGNVLKTQGNLNNLIGLPLTLLQLHEGHNMVVLELGTNKPGEIARLTDIAKPDLGLITNVGPAHLAGFGTLAAVAKEKTALWRHMDPRGTAIVNEDDQALRYLAQSWMGRRVTFGLSANLMVTARTIGKQAHSGQQFIIEISGQAQKVSLALPGEHNVRNALAAAAAAWALGTALPDIAEGLSLVEPVAGRTSILALDNGAFLVDDSYNANPSSVREALKTLQSLRGVKESTAILGEMMELGDSAESLHEEVGEWIAMTGISHAYLTGQHAEDLARGARKKGLAADRCRIIKNIGEVTTLIKGHLGEGDWILVKGSRGMNMEAMVRSLVKEFGSKAKKKKIAEQ